MPLKLAHAILPHHAAAVGHALHRLHARGRGAPAFLRGPAPSHHELAAPHPVYELSRDAVARGAGLEAARRTHVRYLLLSGADAAAAAEIPAGPADAQGGTAESLAAHVGVNEGPFARSTLAAIRAVEADPALQAAGFELRLLRVSALHLVALWLHAGGAAERDRLVPLDPAPSEVPAGRGYEPMDLLAALRPRAIAQARHPYHP